MIEVARQDRTYAIDLHTHSVASPDGSLTAEDYRAKLQQGRLSRIAVTDHNTIDMAMRLHTELGDNIIVGEEITTREGEIIGLYLKQAIPPQLSAQETVRRIREQDGLVYVPHPFETVRKGISLEVLDAIVADVDIIEVHNGRAVLQDYSKQALAWAAEHKISGAASSDAHGRAGWGKTYTVVSQPPTRGTIVALLQEGQYKRGFPGIRGIMYPKVNRLRKKGRHA